MPEKFDPERLLQAIEELNGELHVLWTSIDEFRDELIHEIRNRFGETLTKPTESPESVSTVTSCLTCDNSTNTLAEAVQEGWKDFQHDPKGFSWCYLAECPDCQKAAESNEPKAKGTLFD